jgi:hypothetical protein
MIIATLYEILENTILATMEVVYRGPTAWNLHTSMRSGICE